jgi:hypothetical protein
MSAIYAPRVCVVVPTHNPGDLLIHTLQSIWRQTVSEVQLIVVDDGSSDGTPDLVRRLGQPVEVIEQSNQGVSAARNAGLKLARAPYVAFLDQDDIWHPRHLERQMLHLEARPDVAAVACPYWFWHSGPDGLHHMPEWPSDPGANICVTRYEGWTYHLFLLDCWALTSGTLLRTDSVRQVGGFDESLPFSEDWDLWLRLSRRQPFTQLAWPPVLYRQHHCQGSRRVRAVDYRTRLLERTVAEHGFCSPDGQCLSPQLFKSQLARFRMEFGRQHLTAGNRRIALNALWRAWCDQPTAWRRFGMVVAGLLGWRPGA